MTNSIHHGFAHLGQPTHRARVAQDLIHRGVSDDGLSAKALAPSRSLTMRYRGVAHTLATGAARPDAATVTGATGQIVPAHALA